MAIHQRMASVQAAAASRTLRHEYALTPSATPIAKMRTSPSKHAAHPIRATLSCQHCCNGLLCTEMQRHLAHACAHLRM